MYTSFYNLKLKPFQINSDPAFLWTGEKHKEALATLKYGILNNNGFILLTGDVGTGKTTLINALIQNLGDDIICTSVPDSNLEFIDFINYIAFSFGMGNEFETKGRFVIEFRKFLLDAYQKEKKVLLIIDEAQLLTDDLLEQIRLLSNIDLAETKLLNIFFVGQSEFNYILSKENNRAVRQRLTLNYNVDPLTVDELNEYIKYRLQVAGTISDIFTSGAIQKIFLHSKGFPRRINIICDHCLLSGYVSGKVKIDESIVNECVKELEIPLDDKPNRFKFFLPSFFSKQKMVGLIDALKNFKGLLLIIFAFLLFITVAASYFLYLSVDKQKILVTDNIVSSIETKPDNKSDQLIHEEKAIKKETIPPLEIKKIIIRFKHNTNDFTAEGIGKINKFAETLQKYPGARLVVTGYTDSIGHPEYNKKLSAFRANIVKSFLMGKGIKPEQIQERGLGSENPVESNDTSSGRMMNRRVEIDVSM